MDNGNERTVKTSDYNKLNSIKSIFEQQLMETNSEINRTDIKKIFADKLDPNEIESFNNIIDSMKDDFLEKIIKKLRAQYKYTHMFLKRVVEEEKYTKDSETKIVKESKDLELEKQVEERVTAMKQLITKYDKAKDKVKNYYEDKANTFFENNK